MVSTTDFAFLYIVGFFLPTVSIRTAIKQRKAQNVPPVSRTRNVLWTIFLLAVLGSIALLTAEKRRMPIFVEWRPTVLEVVAGAALLVALYGARLMLLGWMRKGQGPMARLLQPESWGDLPMWALVSGCAGFFEEIVYREVLARILLDLTGSIAIAVIVACVLFGVVHCRQGLRAVMFVTLVAAALHGLVIFANSLYMAMLVHASYDLLVGVHSIVEAQSKGGVVGQSSPGCPP